MQANNPKGTNYSDNNQQQQKKQPEQSSVKLKQVLTQLTVAVFALVVFCTSFVWSSINTIWYRTIPSIQHHIHEVLGKTAGFRTWLWVRIVEWVERIELFQSLRSWFNQSILNRLNETWEFVFAQWESLKQTSPIRELLEKLSSNKVELRNGFVEFAYSFVALVVVCNLVLIRFTIVSVVNLKSMLFSTSRSTSKRQEEAFDSKFEGKSIDSSNTAATTLVDRISETMERYVTVPKWSSNGDVAASDNNNNPQSPKSPMPNKQKSPVRRPSVIGVFPQQEQSVEPSTTKKRVSQEAK